MAKKFFLAFLAIILLNLGAFAQTQISTAAQFLAIQQGGNYIQTADIDLGNVGTKTAAIIQNFSGTYNGNGYTITYQATFQGNNVTDASFGLFGHVTGTIKNLNVNGEATISGNGSDMQIGLLCGKLANSQTETSSGNRPVKYSYTYKMGNISHCSVSGNVTSTVYASNGGGTDAGLIVGQCEGTVEYCMGTGNVIGVGYVGGLVGQLRPQQYRERYQQRNGSRYNDVYRDYVYYPCSITGCVFIGNVTAVNPESTAGDAVGSFAGGICGFAYDNSTIEQCYASGTITSNKAASGIVSTQINGGGNVNVDNSYADVTLVGRETNTATNDITNGNNGNNDNNYDSDDLNGKTLEQIYAILDALNGSDNNGDAHFEYIGGQIVLVLGKVCESPTGLTYTGPNEQGNYTISWNVAGEDRSVTETLWKWTLSGGNLTDAESGSVYTRNVIRQLEPSPNDYTFIVYTDCSQSEAGLLSDADTLIFTVTCPIPTGMQATNITYESFDFTWSAEAESQLIVNGQTYTYPAGNSITKSITGLLPDLEYSVVVKVKCGSGYVEEKTVIVRTAPLPTPTNLSVSTVWNETSGSATITWTSLDGMTYEVNTDGNAQTSPCEITDLEAGSHTAKVRTVKTIAGTKYYSAWVEMPYTISEIPAPSNPQVNYTQDGNYYDVTISWTAGTTPNDGWQIGGEVVNNPYILENQTPGYSTSLAIQEKVGENISRALNVEIQVPCLPVGEVIVEPTQSTVKFTFENANPNRVLYIEGTSYTAIEQSLVVLVGLTSGNTYSYEVREYCSGDNYASKSGTFETAGCYAVSGLSVSNKKITTATVSWVSQNLLEGLKYRITLNGGTPTEQTEKIINFTTLSPSTTYTVSVEEQCGEGWSEPTSITFTTESADFVTAQSGLFNDSSTWADGRIPEGNIGEVTIQAGHIVELTNTLYVTSACQFINKGVLRIKQTGELISETTFPGVVEIETAELPTDKWSFIGAPLNDEGGKYKLESIVRGTRDIAVSMFDYTTGTWSTGENEWATVETEVEAGEGFFAWSFEQEPTIFTTYGDTWDSENEVRIEYSSSIHPTYKLNNGSVTVNKTLNGSYDEAYWVALANPYTFKLDMGEFLSDQSDIQGGVYYRLTYNADNEPVWQTLDDGYINLTEGFFVNFATSGNKEISFNKNQRYTGAKKSIAKRDYLKLIMIEGENESELLFAHNDEANQEYDIFDANKMFSPSEVSEPYFVTEGKALVKEEVGKLPYTATMNVRSYTDKKVKFVADNIPEGYVVFLLDNGQDIRMTNGTEYITNVTEGENENRFQLLVKKQERIERATSNEIVIKNDNRQVTVQSQITNLNIEVYNSVGQKVFETKDYNFTLTDLPSGAYLVKAFYGRVAQTAKIVIQ